MTPWPCETGDCYADAHGGCTRPCTLNHPDTRRMSLVKHQLCEHVAVYSNDSDDYAPLEMQTIAVTCTVCGPLRWDSHPDPRTGMFGRYQPTEGNQP